MKAVTLTLLGVLAIALPRVGATHTELAKAVPASGTVLSTSPAVIEIQFKSEARLTSVIAIGSDKKERRLEFANGKQSNAFSISNPALTAGANEVRWKALSKDGHVVSGKMTYTIKSAP